VTAGDVRLDRDEATGIARLTIDNPERKNAYDPDMRRKLHGLLEELAFDDDTKVVLLRGEGGVFSTGADMNNAYAWYGDGTSGNGERRRPSQRRRLLLTGDTVPAGELAHLGIFTEVVDDEQAEARADWFARKIAKMPADGIVIAKEAFRLVEQLQAYQGEEVLSYMVHAYGTNLQFDEGDFNFVKTRAQHGIKRAFQLRDEHFDVPEPS
jgi:enoyl-CoA hydratase/carnithine racemase